MRRVEAPGNDGTSTMTRRMFVLGLLALSTLEIGRGRAYTEELKLVTLRVEGMT